MRFFVAKCDRKRCEPIIDRLTRMGHTVETIGQGGTPHVNGVPIATLIAVRELGGNGRTPTQVRRILPEQARELGGVLPPWTCGEVIAVAPPINIAKLDRGVRPDVNRAVSRQLEVAVVAASRR